jgi:hypothetical protein
LIPIGRGFFENKSAGHLAPAVDLRPDQQPLPVGQVSKPALVAGPVFRIHMPAVVVDAVAKARKLKDLPGK